MLCGFRLTHAADRGSRAAFPVFWILTAYRAGSGASPYPPLLFEYEVDSKADWRLRGGSPVKASRVRAAWPRSTQLAKQAVVRIRRGFRACRVLGETKRRPPACPGSA
jgi:hypothetical protein